MARKKRKYVELNALKGRIREMGTSYRKIANEIGVAVNTLSDKINGFYPLNALEMEQIATILHIEPQDVVRYFMPSYYETQQNSA